MREKTGMEGFPDEKESRPEEYGKRRRGRDHVLHVSREHVILPCGGSRSFQKRRDNNAGLQS